MSRFVIRKVAVLGAGVMGAQIAAHCANAGVPVILFDLPAKEGNRNGIVDRAIANLKKLNPAPLGTPALADVIEPANYEDHIERITECDLIIEAIAERMDWKHDLYRTVAPVVEVEADWDSIRDSAVALLGGLRQQCPGALSFAVRARRADKSYPRSSGEVERELGRELLTRFPDCRVQLEGPTVEIGVEIRPEGSFVFAERLAGPGGLPVGSTGHGIALLSGGIDSPMAAFLAMKRGLRLDLLFFHSPEFTGTGPLEKVRRLAFERA